MHVQAGCTYFKTMHTRYIFVKYIYCSTKLAFFHQQIYNLLAHVVVPLSATCTGGALSLATCTNSALTLKQLALWRWSVVCVGIYVCICAINIGYEPPCYMIYTA